MPNARMTDPETSHEAAERVNNLTETKQAIVKLLKYPMTDYELIKSYKQWAEAGLHPDASESGIRSRRAELVEDGIIRDSGYRAKSPSGRNMIVWQLV